MAILNYTTTIAAGKTASEIQSALAKHGADMVSVIYRDGEPAGIAFAIQTEYGLRNFQLPANVEGVEATIRKQQKAKQIPSGARYQGTAHARRVAWRILKDWTVAQLAIIEAGMTSLDEVMLPYMIAGNGLPLIEAYRSSAGMRAAIESGSSGVSA